MRKVIYLLIVLIATAATFYFALVILAVSGLRVVLPPDGSETLLVDGHPDMPFVLDPRGLCADEGRKGDLACADEKMVAILADGRVLYRTSSRWLVKIGRFLDHL